LTIYKIKFTKTSNPLILNGFLFFDGIWLYKLCFEEAKLGASAGETQLGLFVYFVGNLKK